MHTDNPANQKPPKLVDINRSYKRFGDEFLQALEALVLVVSAGTASRPPSSAANLIAS
jgi:hypothetical protein